MLVCIFYVQIARETAGAARTRSSLRPLFFEGKEFLAKLGHIRPRDREVVFGIGATSLRGAEATKQSIPSSSGKMDCFAEPVIGRAFARPGGSQ
jgi:hypothetical protein